MLAHEFGSRLNENLIKTRERLLQPEFRFRSLRPVFVPKKDGSDRIICVPTVEDRLIQRLLLHHLDANDKLHISTPVSYGFRQGFGIQKALSTGRNLRRKHNWVLKSDIASFFDTIDRAILKAKIAKRFRNSSVVPLISAAIDTEIECADQQERTRIERAGIVRGKGLRQGMPLSPVLSNFVLREFDMSLSRRGVNLVRYADDFMILADSEAECRNLLELVKQLLEKIGHRVPDLGVGERPKTAFFKPDQAVEFLGFELRRAGRGYQIYIPEEAFKEVHARLKEFESFDDAKRKCHLLSKAISSINSKVDGFKSVYRGASNFNDFSSHLVNCRRNAVLGLLSSIFGHDALSLLDESRLEFVGIGEI